MPALLSQGSLPCCMSGACCGSEETEVWVVKASRRTTMSVSSRGPCVSPREVCFLSCNSGLILGAGMIHLA